MPAALPASTIECYLITVRHLLVLLIMFALSVSNGAGLAAAMCRHQDGAEHAAARQSSDAILAGQAATEEAAALSAGMKGALADMAAAALTPGLLPADELQFPTRLTSSADRPLLRSPPLSGRSLRPLLEPPLV